MINILLVSNDVKKAEILASKYGKDYNIEITSPKENIRGARCHKIYIDKGTEISEKYMNENLKPSVNCTLSPKGLPFIYIENEIEYIDFNQFIFDCEL